MTRKPFKVVCVLLIVLGFCALNVKTTMAETIQWKAHAMWPPANSLYKLFEKFCTNVKIATNDRLEIKPYPAGSLVPNTEALDALKNNTIQAMYMFPAIWSGKEPGFAMLGDLPAAWNEGWEPLSFFNEGGGLSILNELYSKFGVYCVGVSFYGRNESLVSTKPFSTAADLKGLKWRAPEGMCTQLFSKLGVSIVVLPAAELYTSMDKGLVDGGDLSTISLNKDFGIYPVAKYTNYPGWHSMPTLDFVVNQKAWDKLPDDIKQIIRLAWDKFTLESMITTNLLDLKVIPEIQKMGVTIVKWNAEDLAKVRAVAKEAWEDGAKKSPLSKKAYDAYMSWFEKLDRK
jgi:TRAP-type mannitol/chloroaromatic compound transport system substrate-binding protein